MKLLNVDHISVSYGRARALQDVSITIEVKEFIGIIGANRAGKSTLLRAISRLIPLLSGEIFLDGNPLSKVPPHRIPTLGVAHVPEGRQVFPKLTVEENLFLGAIVPSAKAKRAETIEMVYNLFPRLIERKNQLAGTLSGGEQQMLAIARGLMLQPRLLMLDEPSLGLAPLLVDETYEKVQEIRRLGMTVLLVEQNIPKALSCIDRGYVIETGRVILSGSADELKGNPAIREAYLGLL
jgi:branched-chain amino acid transport system ATP-binding protein